MTGSFDVAVIGFGPAGATCANLLGKLGVRTLVVDKSRTVYDLPRAFAIDHEIMRVFQDLGLAEAISSYTRPFTPSEYYGVDGQLIKRLGSVPPPFPLGWPPNLVFTQPPVEAALRAHAATWPSVTVALGNELVGLAQTSDHVDLTLRADDGRTRTIEACYVVGCDGAWSTIRTLSGLHYVDLGFDESWLVVDLHVNPRGLAKLPEVSVQYCDPARPATYLIGPDNHRRWEIMVMPGEDRGDLEREENVWRIISRWISSEDATLWRRASYRFHALVAGEWRSGRAFIAGDAAHQQPPFTGQGMCQGIRDVANLAWKLDRVLSGKSGDVLLDTYASERREHVKALTTVIKGIGRVICERDPKAARARDQRMLAESGGKVITQARQDLIPPLSCGLLSPSSHAANGTIFPQPRIRQSPGTALLDTIAGTGFRLVTNNKSIVAGMRDATSARLGMQLVHVTANANEENARGQTQSGALSVTEVEGVVSGWFQRYQCSAAIVRPDHYVFGVAASRNELERQIEALTAALA